MRGALPRPGADGRFAPTAPPAAWTRRARFAGAWHDVPVHAWDGLAPGWRAAGPAIIVQETATVVVPPAFDAALGDYGDLLLERQRG